MAARDNMPTNYDETKTTTTTTHQTTGPSLNLAYVKSIPGIIKIIEIVLSIITFICSVVDRWEGHGWVAFVAISAFISALIYFILTLLNLITFTSRFRGPWLLIELIYCIVCAVFYLIAAIVAAAFASNNHANVAATAFFAFVATAIFTVDTVYQYRAWRTSDAGLRTQTTTTTSTSPTIEQY